MLLENYYYNIRRKAIGDRKSRIGATPHCFSTCTSHNSSMGMYYTKDELHVLGIDLVDTAESDNTRKQTEWEIELEDLGVKDCRAEWAYSSRSEIMSGSSLPWPDDHLSAIKEERKMKIVTAQKQYELEHGNDDWALDLICEETEVDLRMALWRSDRILELESRVLDFFTLYSNKQFVEAVALASWLLPEHDKYDIQYSSDLLDVLRQSKEYVMHGWTCDGDVPDM